MTCVSPQDPKRSRNSDDERNHRPKRGLATTTTQRLSAVALSGSASEGGLTPIVFDGKRCNESITLSDGGRTATQRASKSWGAVVARAGCAPKTGVHEVDRWIESR
jgi:hypothetical protein